METPNEPVPQPDPPPENGALTTTRKRKPKLSTGREVAEIIETLGEGLTPEERDRFIAIKDDPEMSKFFSQYLGDAVDIKETVAMSIFSRALMQRIRVPEMLMATMFYSIKGCQKAMKFATDELERVPEEGQEGLDWTQKQGFINTLFHASDKLAGIVARAQKLAPLVDVNPPKPKFKNKPPDTLSQTNVAVYVGGDSGKPPEKPTTDI